MKIEESFNVVRINPMGKAGFTLMELLTVLFIIALLVALLLAPLVKARTSTLRVSCLNNQKQLALASALYASDNSDQLPQRSFLIRWPQATSIYYRANYKILRCPGEHVASPATVGTDFASDPADCLPRSYLSNGFNDYYSEELNIPRQAWSQLEVAMSKNSKPITQMQLRSSTILFGEKKSTAGDFWFDIFENGGDDTSGVLELSRHDSKGDGTLTGGSNYIFADNHGEFVKYNKVLNPNLWCVSDDDRMKYGFSL